MAIRFSTPGVIRTEQDSSQVVSPTGTSTGVIVGTATKGIANARTLVGTDKEFIEKFGTPQTAYTADFGIYGALEYLQESNSLYFTRATDGTETYSNFTVSAHTSADSNSATNETLTAKHTSAYAANGKDANHSEFIYDIDDNGLGSGKLVIAALGPGADGDKIAVKVTTMYLTSATDPSGVNTFTSDTSATITALSADVNWAFNYDDSTSAGPAVADTAIWKKVFKLDVYAESTSADATALTSATDGSPDETFYGTIGNQKGPDGAQLNIETVVNGKSNYIYVKNNSLSDGTIPKHTSGAPVALGNGGGSTSQVGTSPVVNAWDFYEDRNKVTINVLIDTYANSSDYTISNKLGAIAASRLDCIATAQVPSTDGASVSTILANDTFSFTLPSYVAKYAGWPQVYDSFNDLKVNIPMSIFAGVIMARTDRIAQTWKTPAGIDRGVLPVLDVDLRFSDTQIGNLYDQNINTAKFIKGVGHVLWGQRTAQRKVSARREVAVRRALLFLQNSIEPTLLGFIFEPNNAQTRLRLVSLVEAFLSTVVAGEGLEAYNIVCDETNNTAQDIDNNVLNFDLYVQNVRSIEFINFRTIISRSGVSLTEV